MKKEIGSLLRKEKGYVSLLKGVIIRGEKGHLSHLNRGTNNMKKRQYENVKGALKIKGNLHLL